MQTTAELILDVTTLEPRLKHPTIFQHFDALEVGQHLIILNDHDPKPLYYQMLGERGNCFAWEYLEQGPTRWKVRITRREMTPDDETLGGIVAKDLRKAEVFRKYGLDFCCGGKKTVAEACREMGLDPLQVESDLKASETQPAGRQLPFNEWGLDFLADYIVNTHHRYVRTQLPELLQLAEKVREVHGGNHPELGPIHDLVVKSAREMEAHMMKEEHILFPYIKELSAARKGTGSSYASQLGSVRTPIQVMEMEHEMVGGHMHEIRALSGDFTPPVDACATYQLLCKLLREFESDLHMHVHLENNILFPKALALEQQIMS